MRRAPEQWHLFQPNWPSDPGWSPRAASRAGCTGASRAGGHGLPVQPVAARRGAGAGRRAWPGPCVGSAHEVLVLAPAEGPPRRRTRRLDLRGRAATALRANGSVAPVALSPAAALRALRFAREAAAPTWSTCTSRWPRSLGYGCLLRSAAAGGHLPPRRGKLVVPGHADPLARGPGRLAARCAVSESAAETARSALGGDVRGALQRRRGRALRRAPSPGPTAGPTVLFLGRHEARKGLGVLLEAFDEVPCRRRAVGGRGRARRPPRCGAGTRLRRRVGGSASSRRGREGRPPGRGRRPVRAVARAASPSAWCCSRRWPPRCVVVASDLPGYRAAAGGQAALVAPGDPAGLAWALEGVLSDLRLGAGRASAHALDAGVAHAEGGPWRAWRRVTWPSTSAWWARAPSAGALT